MTSKRDDAYYEELSRGIEAGQYTTTGDFQLGSELRRGRPVAGSAKQGSSPLRAVRLPADLDTALDAYVAQHGVTASHVMRSAVGEYLERHATS